MTTHLLHALFDHLDRAAGGVSMLLNLANALGLIDALVAYCWSLS